MLDLRPFQKRFIREAFKPNIDTSALSIPRGNGKTTLASHLLERCLTPGDSMHEPGAEYLLGAGSIEQARLCYKPIRAALESCGEYRFIDSTTRLGITHTPSNTKLRVISSNAKTAFGIVGVPFMACDEPGSWETRGGELMFDAISTAMGKPDSRLRACFIGTLAPARAGWWHDLISDGSRASSYVQSLQGDKETWDSWPTIRRCNPLTAISGQFRRKLLEERDAARADTRLKARFLSFRLNIPTGDESEMLLTVDDWQRTCAREVPEREGRPIVGVDLGGGRAWSAATAMWANGRTEAIAVAPGIPTLEEQERRDRVPSGTYRKLAAIGSLRVSTGLRVQPPKQLVEAILNEWGKPQVIVSDRFRLPELQDATRGIKLEPRITRWSESSEDIRALRKLAKDGPLSVDADSELLMTASLAAAMVKNDDAGNVRAVKNGTDNAARDDVAAALQLAAGALMRHMRRKPSFKYMGMV